MLRCSVDRASWSHTIGSDEKEEKEEGWRALRIYMTRFRIHTSHASAQCTYSGGGGGDDGGGRAAWSILFSSVEQQKQNNP
uniref:Uncharacterized protein n=1 Tax=Caenorhabditis japonica TaxID=281687 RepID=A0A8R1EGX0_CAEJA